ncbi:hypothetical protein GCM10010493_83990 [Streptomyces lavendulae subsp. grasserius]
MESQQLPGMRPDVAITYVQCAVCGAMGSWGLDGQPLQPAIDQMGAHIRERRPGENLQDALQLVPDVGHPDADRDVAEWVAEYNERAGRALWTTACETSPVSTTRRPLGHGPAPLDDDQAVRTARGRTAAERASEETPQQPASRTETAPSARRGLGAGPGS